MKKVHIIGAGLAGLAAGVKLVAAGKQVILYEAAAMAGGRCRSYFDAEFGHILDNGNHLILGANKQALAYIDAIGARTSFISPTHPKYEFVDIKTGKSFTFKTIWAVSALARLAFARQYQTVAECINTSSALYKNFIEPFCTSALNTKPSEASAVILRNTLWQIIKYGKQGLLYYLPRESLAASLINPALELLKAHGSTIKYNTAVKSLTWNGNTLSLLHCKDKTIEVSGDHVILATPAQIAAKLLPELIVPTQYNSVVNGHFISPDIAFPSDKHFIGVIGGTAEWIFWRNGIISTTTSAANNLSTQDNASIAKILWKDICTVFNFSAPLPPYKIISEKRATHAALPTANTLIKTRYKNLCIAGDYTLASVPASIDAAVKSGFTAADIV